MTISIEKRDGRIVLFDEIKIKDAIAKAAVETKGSPLSCNEDEEINRMVLVILEKINLKYPGETVKVENIQDIVEEVLMCSKKYNIAKNYILYRNERTKVREGRSELNEIVEKILVHTDKDNANISNGPSAKLLQIAEAASVSYYNSKVLPKRFKDAFSKKTIHIHDYAWFKKTMTCLQIPLGRLLKNGFNNGHGHIRTPKGIEPAAALVAIILQSNQNEMHG